MSAIEISRLSRRYPGQWAVRDLSLCLEKGQILGFIGPNGAGKTTTMRILASLDLPSKGWARVAGFDCVDQADQVRQVLGYMPDSYGSYPNMTVQEYLDFFARSYGLRRPARQQRVAEIIAFCQMEKMAAKEVTQLSKGMKQRLCLGRCLINDPQVLILDEPTAGLDPRARIEFRELLRLLIADQRSVLISSHILSELEEVCDRVAIIEGGRLVAEGSVPAVKARARAGLLQQADIAADHCMRVEIRVEEGFAGLLQLLAEQPNLRDLRDEGHGCYTCTLPRSSAAQRDLLRALVTSGAPIYHCAAQDENLEQAFMHLTRGEVS